MSRNFEDAYKAEVQLNIPDLWDRIESGLPEKTIVPVTETKGEKTENTNLNHRSNSKKKKKPYAWIKWASLAAAAMLIILLLPVVAGVGILNLLSGSSSDMAANESAAAPEMMYQEVVMEEAVEEIQVDTDGAGKENMAENEEDVYVSMDVTAEAPASDEKFTAEENPLLNDGRIVLAMGMKAKVVGCESSSDNSIYCRMWLEIPEEAYETFERYEFFQNGQLEVRYYYDDYNSTPVGGSTYKFDIIEVGDGSWLVAKLQGNN